MACHAHIQPAQPLATAAPPCVQADVQRAPVEVGAEHRADVLIQPPGGRPGSVLGEPSTASSSHPPDDAANHPSARDPPPGERVRPGHVSGDPSAASSSRAPDDAANHSSACQLPPGERVSPQSQQISPAQAHTSLAAFQEPAASVAESPRRSVEWDRSDAGWPRRGSPPLGAPRDDWDYETLQAKIATRASERTPEPLSVEEVLVRQQYMAIAGDAWPSPGGLPAESSRGHEDSVDAQSSIEHASYDGDSAFEVPVDGQGKDAEILRRALVACNFVRHAPTLLRQTFAHASSERAGRWPLC